MKISLKWIHDFVDVADFLKDPEVLVKDLTAAGLEVEAVEQMGNLEHVVVAEILELGKHPDANRLTLCQVNVGEAEPVQIICGASNHKQGDFVVAALPGAVLPGDFKIKKSKIRGVESFGMLCSNKELGLGEAGEGILILDPGSPVGENYFQWSDQQDVLLEINVTPNRADCLSHLGLAREISALMDRPLKEINIKHLPQAQGQSVALKVLDPEQCSRYVGCEVQNINVTTSPQWLQERLMSVGLNSKNNIVDLTNYLMMGVGQPMHAFDRDKLKDHKIEVGPAPKAQKFKALNDEEYEVKGGELSILNGDGDALAIAGVMGGAETAISEKTKNIFLESAHFLASSVRRSSRSLGIHSDSSYRFSRGCYSGTCDMAMKWMVQEIQKMCPDAKVTSYQDEWPLKTEPKTIVLTPAEITDRLGFDVSTEDIKSIFKKLGFELYEAQGSLKLTPPGYRVDIHCKEDLIEEVGRMWGYDQIPSILPQSSLPPSVFDKNYLFKNKIVDLCVKAGWNQNVHYHFESKQDSELQSENSKAMGSIGFQALNESVKISNPLSEQTYAMRSSMYGALLKSFVHNYRHGKDNGDIFEVGQIFREDLENKNYLENEHLGLMTWGQSSGFWNKPQPGAVSFYQLKGTLGILMSSLKIKSWKLERASEAMSFLHPLEQFKIVCEGKSIGFMGQLHPEVLKSFKINGEAAFLELNLDLLKKGYPRSAKIQDYSLSPMVQRDISLRLKSWSMDQVTKVFKKASGALFKDLNLVDQYQGEDFEVGEKSLTFRLSLQSEKGDLEEKQLLKIQDQIFAAFKEI